MSYGYFVLPAKARTPDTARMIYVRAHFLC